jgi:hypothetical protein
MSKILFIPFGIVSGIIAGLIGKKLFATAWSVLDDGEPPDPTLRDVPWKKLVVALVVEGAISRAVRGIIDRGAREGFSTLTGFWPGEERGGSSKPTS